MKELLRKKSIKISLLLILLLVVMGIAGINVQSAQKSQEYEAHIAAAEKYLSDLDYEQAIAEYTMAFEIDPKEEVVDALEQTYLAYAQTCIDAGDFEKAVSILEEGYEQIGRESLQNKIAEVAALQAQKQLEEEQRRIEEEQRASGMVEFLFQMTDITVMGYDLSGDHFAQMEGLFPVEGGGYWMENAESVYVEGSGSIPGGYYEIYTDYDYMNEDKTRILLVSKDSHYWEYCVDSWNDRNYSVRLRIYTYDRDVVDYAGINVPVTAGETYEDWCRVMQIDRMKENSLRPEERNGMVGIWREDGSCIIAAGTGEDREHWLFSSEGYQGMYTEFDRGDGYRYCELRFGIGDHWSRGEWPIESIEANINPNGAIMSIEYRSFPIVE